MNATDGIGRYSAFTLSSVVTLDLIILAFYDFKDGTTIADDIRASMHLIHLVWASLFFFNRFYHSNPDIAVTAFFAEWLDLAITIVVLFIIHQALSTSSNSSCLNQAICVCYGLFLACKLIGWIFPMMLIVGWGTELYGKRAATHLFILDIVTDVPVVITILITGAYKSDAVIFIDCIWKTLLTVRSLSYYLVYQIWFDKGKRLFTRSSSFK